MNIKHSAAWGVNVRISFSKGHFNCEDGLSRRLEVERQL